MDKRVGKSPVYGEDDLLPLSALQHLLFCERRASLVHVEQIWDENWFTVDGRHLHERAHDGSRELIGNVLIVRGLHLRSLRLGLSGKADVVEFHRVDDPSVQGPSVGGMETCVKLPRVSGYWQPFPVEYKRGRLRREEGYEVQLCAQSMCLEEMLKVRVATGALFFGQTRRRLEVAFDDGLRRRTETAAERLHEIIRSRETVKARYDKKCDSCSLSNVCLPKTTGTNRSVLKYLASTLRDSEQ